MPSSQKPSRTLSCVRDLIAHAEGAICRHQLLADGDPVLVAVSGGLDSMALLTVLMRLRDEHRWNLTVAHFNHKLRGTSSDQDELFVRTKAAALGLPARVGRRNVKTFAEAEGLDR